MANSKAAPWLEGGGLTASDGLYGDVPLDRVWILASLCHFPGGLGGGGTQLNLTVRSKNSCLMKKHGSSSSRNQEFKPGVGEGSSVM